MKSTIYRGYVKLLAGVILVSIILSGCLAPSTATRYIEKVATDSTLNKHASHFEAKYGSTTSDEAYYGFFGLIYGNVLKLSYELDVLSLKRGNHFEALPGIVSNLNMHFGYYSKIWNQAIDASTGQYATGIEFNSALMYLSGEFAYLGVFEELDKIESLLKIYFSSIDSNSMPKTIEVYGVIMQLIAQAKEPSGSLRTFNQNINMLTSQFKNLYAVAELEQLKN